MHHFAIGFLWALCVAFFACQPAKPASPPLSEAQLDALEDSLDYVAAKKLQAQIVVSIAADAETNAVTSPQVDDDAADDMAVWVHPTNPERSLLVGSNKKGGVVVFDLQGREQAFYPTGRINNIDVTYGMPLGGKKVDLVGCTNRTAQAIDLMRIDPATGRLSSVVARPLTVDTAVVKDVYGFCFYHSDRHYLFVNGKNGMVQQFALVATAEGLIDLKLVRQIKFESQTEGMVADENYQVLYVGEEDRGIWKVSLEPGSTAAPVLLPLSGEDNANIKYDLEGLTLYKRGNEGFLLASSQGNYSYAVFERRPPNTYLGSFKIADGAAVDGVEETDGIDAVAVPLGPGFPQGVFLAQDGFNFDKERPQRQNFKMVRWEKIEAALRLGQ